VYQLDLSMNTNKWKPPDPAPLLTSLHQSNVME